MVVGSWGGASVLTRRLARDGGSGGGDKSAAASGAGSSLRFFFVRAPLARLLDEDRELPGPCFGA